MALVSKILETTLTAGSTAVTFTDSDIPNSLIRVFSSNSDVIPESRILSGNSLTVTYAPQTSNMDVALEIVKQGLDIVDNVLSEDTDKALSAKQGYLLSAAIGDVNDRLDGLVIPENITDLDDVDVTSITDGQILEWDADSQKFINANMSVTSKVFLDVDNVITTLTGNANFQTYTATEDCYCIGTPSGGTNSVAIQIDGVTVNYTPITGARISVYCLIKKGQALGYRIGTGETVTIYGTK